MNVSVQKHISHSFRMVWKTTLYANIFFITQILFMCYDFNTSFLVSNVPTSTTWNCNTFMYVTFIEIWMISVFKKGLIRIVWASRLLNISFFLNWNYMSEEMIFAPTYFIEKCCIFYVVKIIYTTIYSIRTSLAIHSDVIILYCLTVCTVGILLINVNV